MKLLPLLLLAVLFSACEHTPLSDAKIGDRVYGVTVTDVFTGKCVTIQGGGEGGPTYTVVSCTRP